jgi:PAS domain S-box-containing protein
MDATANQTKRLQGCINDLISLLAFPAMWSGRDPAEIVGMLLDVLVGMLRLEFAYVRLNDRGGGLIEMARHAPPGHLGDEPQAIGQRLNDSLGADPRKWPRLATNPFGDGNLSIAPLGCGRDGEIGAIVAGSPRNDFPWETETVLLSVAANQASIGLQEAWRLTEQKQTANQLEKQVAERTEGLAAANEKLTKSEAALHKALDEIKKSEAKLRQVIDTIPTTAWTARPDGYCDFLNQVWLEYAGMTAEQAQGWGWAEAIHPDDREQLVEEWQSSLASGIPVDTEARIRRFDSSYRWFLIRGNPLRDESGNILKWYGTCTDIEDRKRWEQILRARELSWRQIVDNIPGLVATTGAMGEVEFLNRQTLEYFGRTNEELKDWALIDAVHPDDLPRVIETRKRSIEAGQIYDVEHRCRRADGVYRWFQVRGLPVRDPEHKINAWYLLLTDIDDRKKAEEALQSSQRDLSLMIDVIPGMIHTARPDGYLDYFNRRWLEYMGCSLSDIEGWNWTARIHPDDLPGIVDKWRACVASGENCEYETRVRRGDGQYRWMFHRKVPLRDEHGNIVRWYGTSLDIEDRKRAEAALQSSERNLSLMINAIPTIIGVMRADGTPLYGNQGVTDYTGLTIEDILKEDFRTRVFHPEDMESLREERRLAFSRPVPFENEQRALGKDGKYRWFLFRYKPLLDEAGNIDRWYMAAFDIDDRKRAEAQVEQAYLRLAEAQRLSKTGSFITDLVADDHNWSEETFRIFDFDPATKVTVQRIRDMIHPEDLPSFDAMIARAMTGVNVDFVFRIVTSRSAMKHIRGMARIILQDRPLFIGALQDITESKVAEEALNRARSELAHVARATTLNTLTASIAHEINQPLASLVTNASICLRRLNGDPPNVDGARETVQRTIRDANRASDVITRLRALYSKKEFTLETLDLNEVTTEVIALSLSDLQRNRVILRSELAEDLPPVIGDRVQLQQVTLNLIRNASDAMVCVEDRPRQLLVRTQREGDDRVRLSVQDAGCGVNPQDFERLFEAFYTTKSGGMGIGLSVSRSIIERHQGRLWAEPNDGPGTTFSFSIPCGPGSAKDAAA